MNTPEILHIRPPKNNISELYYQKMFGIESGKDDNVTIFCTISTLKDHRIPLGAN